MPRTKSIASIICFATAMLLTCGSADARPDETVIQNDDGGGSVACPCFVTGEELAAWLTSPCGGEITSVQIGWGSVSGGNPDSLESEIKLYRGGVFPNPGPEMTVGELAGPVLSDGFINAYDTSFVTNNTVTAGETFVVSLEILTNSSPPFGPAPVHDGTNCQNGRNAVRAIPGGWFNACSLGVSGDWVIRAVVKCTTVTCPGDIDVSGDVGFSDILQIIGNWGPCPGGCAEDLSGNDNVDFADILIVIAQWGPC